MSILWIKIDSLTATQSLKGQGSDVRGFVGAGEPCSLDGREADQHGPALPGKPGACNHGLLQHPLTTL